MFMERPAGCSWNGWPDAVECAKWQRRRIATLEKHFGRKLAHPLANAIVVQCHPREYGPHDGHDHVYTVARLEEHVLNGTARCRVLEQLPKPFGCQILPDRPVMKSHRPINGGVENRTLKQRFSLCSRPIRENLIDRDAIQSVLSIWNLDGSVASKRGGGCEQLRAKQGFCFR